ncbi:MAG: membrane protein insertase YidC [Eubacterium sp.]|nr:membrane protein insertase YidC [Eubacterium sp.]
MFNLEFITMAAPRISNGMGIFKPLYWLFGQAMKYLLIAFDYRYFLALIVFTVLTRLVLFPLNVRQQKTMAQTNRIQPKIQKIQKKYNVNSISDPKQRQAANKKMQDEMQALYQREGHNPMNMGCGPMAFQMVFLMGIIGIIYYPLQYIIGIKGFDEASEAIAKAISFKGSYFQLEIIQGFDKYKDILATKFPEMFTPEKIKEIIEYKSHLAIGSLDMSKIPQFKEGGILLIIPALAFATSMLSSVISTLIQKKTNPAMAQQSQQMMLMMLMMPLFSGYIAFKVPAAVGFYWIISNIVAVIQQLVTAKFFPPRRNIARQMVENTIERRAREESIKKAQGR